jgi:hypothetical protein
LLSGIEEQVDDLADLALPEGRQNGASKLGDSVVSVERIRREGLQHHLVSGRVASKDESRWRRRILFGVFERAGVKSIGTKWKRVHPGECSVQHNCRTVDVTLNEVWAKRALGRLKHDRACRRYNS